MTRVRQIARTFLRDTRGATLVEMGIVIPLFLLIFFSILDYGRLYWIESMAQKATSIAARTAAVRPAACPGVPTVHAPAPLSTAQFGTFCRTGGACRDAGEQTCLLDVSNATAAEIWDRIEPLMPPGSDPANVRLRYTFDGRIGFLGGPYTPIVTAELEDLNFDFVSPLGALAALAASDDTFRTGLASSIPIPTQSVSLPGEDLAAGVSN
ncbi:pilus assembly protein [Rhodobacterales bacterium HKCCE3408]|nr:pilus assembly protein [Rhodobacterales bacterium HKCCE3408]